MNTKFLLFVCLIGATTIASAQNVGVGTNSPNTKLDISGAVRFQETSNLTITNSSTNNLPANVSELQLIPGSPLSAGFSLSASNSYYVGQQLVIYNNTAYACNFVSTYSIPAQQAMSFIYSNTPGSTSATSWVATSPAAGSGNYIQNQTSADQSGAGFRTVGNGLFNNAASQVAIGTATPSSGYQLTLTPNATTTKGINITTSGVTSDAIDVTLSGATSTAYGLNISAASGNYNGVNVTNSSTAVGPYYGVKGSLSGVTTTGSSPAGLGYLGYRSSGPKTFGVWGSGGDYAGYFDNKVAITSANPPTGTADLEIQNTTSGGSNPATVSLRQTTSTTTSGTVLSNLNFGDNYVTTPQAQIEVLRDATASGSSYPTAMVFSTTPASSTTLTERMRITNTGALAINGATNYGTTGNTLMSNTNGPPTWQALNLAGGSSYVSGLLPSANGGTGLNSSSSSGFPLITSGTWTVISGSTLASDIGAVTSVTANSGTSLGSASTAAVPVVQLGAPAISGATANPLLQATYINQNANALNIGTDAAANALTLGSTNTTSTVALQSGTSTGGAVNINSSNNSPTNINAGTSTGTVTIGGTGTQTIAIGNGAGVKTVNLGSTNTTSATTIYSGSSGVSINGSNSQPTSINTGTSTGALNLGNTSGNNVYMPGLTTAGVIHNAVTSGLLSSSLVSLTADVTGTLSSTNGGTGINSSGSSGYPLITSGTWSVISGATLASNIGALTTSNLSGTAGQVAYFSGTNTVTSSGNHLWNNTNAQMTVTSAYAGNPAITSTNSSTTAASSGLYGAASGTSGAVYGVWGTTPSTTAAAAAVYGSETGTTGATYGVYGTNASTTGVGVLGVDNAAGVVYGVEGSTSSSTNNAAGVYGVSSATTGLVYGVKGTCASTTQDASGVFGSATGNGLVVGVEGTTSSTTAQACGLFGYATATASSGNTYGAECIANTGNTGIGVWGVGGGDGTNTIYQFGNGTGMGGLFVGNTYGVMGEMVSTSSKGNSYNLSTASSGGANALAGVLGYSAAAANSSAAAYYNFGVYGQYNDFGTYYAYRSGGVIGYNALVSVWGSLGYESSSTNSYGLYFAGTNSDATGSGYLPTTAIDGIGSGGVGGVIGSWTRGQVMGQISSGELFAAYNMGDAYTSGHQAELVTVGEKRVAAYSLTSADIKVYGDGSARLQNGTYHVSFDPSYASMLGAMPNVTVSPMGECEGLYIVSVDKEGFTVKEMRGGHSDVQFTWIAVGKRIDADSKTELPADLASTSFDANMKDVMFNENDEVHSGKPVWWDGQRVRFDQHAKTHQGHAHESKQMPTPGQVATEQATKAPVKGK